MGKVGTRTVAESLRKIVPNPVLVLHHLANDLDEQKKEDELAGLSPLPAHWAVGTAVRNILYNTKSVRCKVISLVRDPIATVLSMYVHTSQHARLQGVDITSEDETIDTEKAIVFLRSQLVTHDSPKLRYIWKWFDHEFNKPLKIDVLGTPFEKTQGYTIYNHGEMIEAMVIRVEDLDEEGPQALAKFLDLSTSVVLSRENVRAEMKNAEAYRYIKRKLYLDRITCEYLYSTPFVQQFYTQKMINGFIDQWSE